MMRPMREVIVSAPTGYANALLNGSRALILEESPALGITTVLLVSGRETGRVWQFKSDHLIDAARSTITPERNT